MKLASFDNIANSSAQQNTSLLWEFDLGVNVKSFKTKERIIFVGSAAIRCALKLSAHNKLVIVWLAGHWLFIALALVTRAINTPMPS